MELKEESFLLAKMAKEVAFLFLQRVAKEVFAGGEYYEILQ
jgi:hypothetical protein